MRVIHIYSGWQNKERSHRARAFFTKFHVKWHSSQTDRALSLAIFRVEGLPYKKIIFVREHGYGSKESKFSGFMEN